MIEFLRSLYTQENNEEMYVLNVTHTICIIGMIFVCCIVRFFISDPKALYLSFGICVFFLLTMAEANRTKKIKRSIIFMSIIFNFVYMPCLFLMFNRNISVIPVYFLFGLMYSVILLDAKTAIILGSIETIYYVVLLLGANQNMPTGLDNPTPKIASIRSEQGFFCR